MQIKRGSVGSRSNLKFIGDLEQDVTAFENMILLNCARFTSELFEKEFMSIMDKFYSDYTPKFYDRTFGVKNDSYKRYYKKHTKSYRGGLTLSGEYLNPENYRINDMDQLLDITVFRGWHGSKSVYVTTPSPWVSLINFRDKVVNDLNSRKDSYGIVKKAENLALSSYVDFVKRKHGR